MVKKDTPSCYNLHHPQFKSSHRSGTRSPFPAAFPSATASVSVRVRLTVRFSSCRTRKCCELKMVTLNHKLTLNNLALSAKKNHSPKPKQIRYDNSNNSVDKENCPFQRVWPNQFFNLGHMKNHKARPKQQQSA